MSRSTTYMRVPPRERFSGPWSQNPWLDLRNVGPRKDQGIDTQQQIHRLSASPALPANAMVEPGAAQALLKEDKRRQRTALGTWDDEGGRNGRDS